MFCSPFWILVMEWNYTSVTDSCIGFSLFLWRVRHCGGFSKSCQNKCSWIILARQNYSHGSRFVRFSFGLARWILLLSITLAAQCQSHDFFSANEAIHTSMGHESVRPDYITTSKQSKTYPYPYVKGSTAYTTQGISFSTKHKSGNSGVDFTWGKIHSRQAQLKVSRTVITTGCIAVIE